MRRITRAQRSVQVAALAWIVATLIPVFTTAHEESTGVSYWEKTFPDLREPSVSVRPKARTRSDAGNLAALAEAGFGGAEVGVDFRAQPRVARRKLHSLLQTAHRLGIHVDLAPGGGQPYQSPGISEAGSMQQLVATHVSLQGGQDYLGTVEPPKGLAGHPVLVAVTAARVSDDSGTPVLLDAGSSVDLTSKLDRAHLLHWEVPPGRWLLFAFWQRATGQVLNNKPFEDPSVWSGREPRTAQGKYFTADIFSSTGIAGALEYLDKEVLPGNVGLLRGGDFAHDSLEVQAELFWTGDLPQQFARRRGYSLIPFLPALYTPRESSFDPLDSRWGGALPPRPFDFAGIAGTRVRHDYQQTLTDLYTERYLKTISDWAHSRGLRTRVQVAYNYFALDMLRSARAVDIPENESFDSGWSKPFDASIPAYASDRWRHAMDSYRLTGSGAHLAGRTRATIEFGDDFAIYRKQPVDYAQQLNEALAGGITMGVLTAFVSTDNAWPVPQGLAAIGLGDDWTAGWPQWRDWRALARYFARSTRLLESGQARVDIAIYHDRGLSTVHDSAPLFASAGLEGGGYTYDFIDPQALLAPEAGVVAGKLFGRRVGYRALILNNQPDIPFATARAILAMARRGLHVVIVGTPPHESTGFLNASEQDRAVAQAVAVLTSLPTVARVASENDVVAALKRLGVSPAASFGAASALLSVHRRSEGNDLWWIFNPTDGTVAATAALAATGAPYTVDLWSGAINRIAQWTAKDGRTTVPLVLMPHESTAVLVRHGEPLPVHVVSMSAGRVVQSDAGPIVLDAGSGQQALTLSNGQIRRVDGDALPRSMNLTQWHLQLDEMRPEGVRHRDLGVIPLVDWRSIPELKDAVGRATYSCKIELSPEWFGSDREALLTVGKVAGAMQLAVNGHLVTEQTIGFGRWPVTHWLKSGTNTVTVRLDTTLLNKMVALRAAGEARYQTGPTALLSAPSGLLGPVVLESIPRVQPFAPSTKLGFGSSVPNQHHED